MSHKVKIHRWTNGTLEIIEHEFESADAAITFTTSKHREHQRQITDVPVTQVIKVYDENDQLVHATDGSATNTYA